MSGPVNIFDRTAVRRHRERAAARLGEHDFLVREVAARLNERLGDIRRKFSLALALGGPGAAVEADLVVRADQSIAMLAGESGPRVVFDEEWLPIADHSLDLATSLLTLHWVNDLPGALTQIRRALRPDGLFMAAMFGAETLIELRTALASAESSLEGGVSPRLSPTVDLQDMGALLQRAGFALPVVDIDTITVTYPDAFALMHDLRGMGETNAVNQRRKRFTRRSTLMAAAEAYKEQFANPDGRLPATFQIVWLTAWAPDRSQQQALRPGSARARLADALDTQEKPAGDKARPR